MFFCTQDISRLLQSLYNVVGTSLAIPQDGTLDGAGVRAMKLHLSLTSDVGQVPERSACHNDDDEIPELCQQPSARVAGTAEPNGVSPPPSSAKKPAKSLDNDAARAQNDRSAAAISNAGRFARHVVRKQPAPTLGGSMWPSSGMNIVGDTTAARRDSSEGYVTHPKHHPAANGSKYANLAAHDRSSSGLAKRNFDEKQLAQLIQKNMDLNENCYQRKSRIR